MAKLHVEALRKFGKRDVGDRFEMYAPHARQVAALGFVKEIKVEEVHPEIVTRAIEAEKSAEEMKPRQKRQYRRRDMVAEGNRELVAQELDDTADE